MPCYTQDLTQMQKARQTSALDRLERGLALGTVKVKIGAAGSLSFAGWKDNEGLADLCAYRRLGNSAALRKAIARAEAISGKSLNKNAIAVGIHSHDGGNTWGSH